MSDTINAIFEILAPEDSAPGDLYQRLANSDEAKKRTIEWDQQEQGDPALEAQRRELLPALLSVEQKHAEVPRQWPAIFRRSVGRIDRHGKALPETWREVFDPGHADIEYRIEPYEAGLAGRAKGVSLARDVTQIALGLAESLVQTEEIRHAEIFNNGQIYNTASVADGLPLFSPNHLIRDGVYSNILEAKSQLNEASLEAAVIQVRRELVDARGLRLFAQPRLLVVPIALEFAAARLGLAGVALPADGYRVLDYLEDMKAWFVVTTIPGLQSIEWKPFRLDLCVENDTLLVEATQTYGCGHSNPRACVGSFPT